MDATGKEGGGASRKCHDIRVQNTCVDYSKFTLIDSSPETDCSFAVFLSDSARSFYKKFVKGGRSSNMIYNRNKHC